MKENMMEEDQMEEDQMEEDQMKENQMEENQTGRNVTENNITGENITDTSLYIPPLTGHPEIRKIQKTSRKGLLSLLLGALAFLLFAAFINIPLAIASIVLGCIQLAGRGSRGCAIGGILLSGASLFLFGFFWVRLGVNLLNF